MEIIGALSVQHNEHMIKYEKCKGREAVKGLLYSEENVSMAKRRRRRGRRKREGLVMTH